MRRILLPFIMLLACAYAYAQPSKNIQDVQQVWLGYFNQSRLSDKWGVWLDAHLRTKEEFTNHFSSSIARVGLTYYLSDATKLTVGYAFINHYPGDAHKKIAQPEHRPWQQVQWHTKYKHVRTMQWLRLEERYRRKVLNDSTLAGGYNFNFRVRYNFLLQVPLTKQASLTHRFSFIVNDEVHLNFGKEIVYNTFDQNRFFVGLAYHVNNHDNIQFGYMNLFQQQASGNNYRSLHTARVFYFHNLDIRRKQQ